MNSYNSIDPYGTYETKGLSPYEMMMKMSSWNNELRTTLVKTNEDLSNVESVIVQQADAIALRVLKEDYTGEIVASMIALDPYSVTIIANSLNLSGYVTFSSLSGHGTTVINGANIMTGTILSDRIAVNELSAISTNIGTIYAGTINGIQLNSVNINTSYDATVGNNLHLGTSAGGSYQIRFGGQFGGGRISYNFDNMYIGAIETLTLSGQSRISFETMELNFNGASVLTGVPRSTTSGLEFGYASGTNELVIRISGSERGRVKLT